MRIEESPAVSIIIPCYNYGKYLEEAIDSCIQSTFTDFEIIVVNDGSTDPETIQVLEQLNKPKTRIIHQDNKGLSAARNAGIKLSRGKYILPLDADDTIHPTLLQKEVAILEARPEVGFVSSWLQCFGDTKARWKFPAYNFYKLLFNNIMVVTSLFRKDAWEQVGGYNEEMTGYADWDFWISLGEKGFLGHIIPEVLFHYRRHGHTMSMRSKERKKQLINQIRNNHPALYTKEKLAELKQIWEPTRSGTKQKKKFPSRQNTNPKKRVPSTSKKKPQKNGTSPPKTKPKKIVTKPLKRPTRKLTASVNRLRLQNKMKTPLPYLSKKVRIYPKIL
ncbi:glycosyltransferase family 2 protein [Brevibacillus sp. H7]|uniref:glycosyltransferase family 2 protein n=1 Tax=Brevibacillus sp. H7 TaxID=3349138 RepID=UPI003814CD2D